MEVTSEQVKKALRLQKVLERQELYKRNIDSCKCAVCIKAYEDFNEKKEEELKLITLPVIQRVLKQLSQKIQTQKAKGFKKLYDVFYRELTLQKMVIPAGNIVTNESTALQSAQLYGNKWPLFLRPCPIVPRHGFVESVKIPAGTYTEEKSLADAIYDKLLEARKVDPKAELIVMPFIDGKFSAVWTPGLVSIAEGNDGVTSGTSSSNSILIPVNNPYEHMHDETGLSKKDVPFVEYIITNKPHNHKQIRKIYPVQFRGGPPIKQFASNNFVPFDLKNVDEWISAEMYTDLIAFENDVAKAKKIHEKDGKVFAVHAPGFSLCSHHAIHAIINNVPFITTQNVALPIAKNSEPKKEYDKDKIARGIVDGLSLDITNDTEVNDYCAFAVFALHCASVWTSSEDSYYLGVGIALLLRLSAVACIGEYRHKNTNLKKHGRTNLYVKAFKNYLRFRKKLGKALDSFASHNWGGSFGGAAWATCAAHTVDLDEEVIKFLSDEEVSVETLISLSHRLINVSHNCGKMLTKFVSSTMLDGLDKGWSSVYLQGAFYRIYQVIDAEVSPYNAYAFGKKLSGLRRIKSSALVAWKDGAWITRIEELNVKSQLKLSAIAYQDKNGNIIIEYKQTTPKINNLYIDGAHHLYKINEIVVPPINGFQLSGKTRRRFSSQWKKDAFHVTVKKQGGRINFINNEVSLATKELNA